MDVSIIWLGIGLEVVLIGTILAATVLNAGYCRKVRSAGRLADRVLELEQRFEGVHALMKRVDNRERMRDARAGRRPGDNSTPDPATDPEGWLKHKQRELNRSH